MDVERTPSRLGPRQIPLDDLLPHPLNSIVMSAEYREKLLTHIRRTSRYPFLVVRPHELEPGKYQVLDGHHRISILRELGHTEARCDVWDVDDREAKLLLATLNRLEGQDQPLRRAQLLHELLAEMSAVDLGGLLPETEAEIRDLHSLLEFPAEEIAAQLAAEAAERPPRRQSRVSSSSLSPSDPLRLLGIVPPGSGRARAEARLRVGMRELVPVGEPVGGLEPHGNPVMTGAEHPVQGPARDHEICPRLRLGDALDQRQLFLHRVAAIGNALLYDAAEEGDLRQAGADVIVEVGSDAAAYLFQLQQAFFPGAA